MAWSWSYGPETHAAIRENILAIELHGKGGLREIFAEWRANQTRRSGGRATGHDSDFDRRRYDRALRHVDEMAARMATHSPRRRSENRLLAGRKTTRLARTAAHTRTLARLAVTLCQFGAQQRRRKN